MTGLNVNSYASKKTFAQGLLDLALLASNAAQLKFILSAGDEHPFYTLLLTLIIVSICLQVRLYVNFIILIENNNHIPKISYLFVIVIVTKRITLKIFFFYILLSLKVAQAIICIILGLILDINKIDEVRKADIINNIAVAIIVVIVALNIVISAFEIKTVG